MKYRLGYKSSEDFYEEFKRRFFGAAGKSGAASKLSKEGAIEIFNKYLPDGQKLENISKPEDIKSAFRHLAMKYHPDKASNNEEAKKFEKIFIEISDAFSILK